MPTRPSSRPPRQPPRALGAFFLASAFFSSASPLAAANYIVDTADDIVAIDGKISLREAVMASSTNAPVADVPAGDWKLDDSIGFFRDMIGTPILLTQGHLEIVDPTLIDGWLDDRLTIDAQSQRGLPRTVDLPDAPNAAHGTDIGAVEATTGLGAGAPPPIDIPTLSPAGLVGLVLLLGWVARSRFFVSEART